MKHMRTGGLLLAVVICCVAMLFLGAGPRAKAKADRNTNVSVGANSFVQAMADARAICAQSSKAPENAAFKPFATEPLDGAGPGQAVKVDVRGLKTMRLVTTLLKGPGNLQIWGDARLIDKDGKITFLSTLKPAYISVGWGQMHIDKNWEGNPLQIGDKKFQRGLWVHADADIAFALDGKYETFEAWVGMDKARVGGSVIFKVLGGSLADQAPALWKKIAQKFPAQAAWITQDLGKNQEITSIASVDLLKTDETLIRKALGPVGAVGKPALDELAALKKDKVASDDPRWLNLYARAAQARQCMTTMAKIGHPALRKAMEAHVAAALEAKLASDDAKWNQISACAALAAGDGATINVVALKDAIELLTKSWPDRFDSAADIAGQTAQQIAAWDQAVEAASKLDAAGLKSIAQLQSSANSTRRSLVASLRGMKQFLQHHTAVDLMAEWEQQHEVLNYDIRNRAHFEKYASETYRPESLVLAADRDPLDIVLRRTQALIDDLNKTSAAAQIAGIAGELTELKTVAAKIEPTSADARFVLYAQACKIRRQVAMRNPLLDFDQMVFIKRHRAIFNHMCDQYYGMAQHPGGGLYVLSGAFGMQPQVRDVLENATVANGRIKGEKLSGGPLKRYDIRFDGLGNLHGEETEGGSFLSPELSYDGKTIAFAYVECRGDRNHWHHIDPTKGHWAEGRVYHVFSVNTDGTNLRQLTDGTWNDFDPCFLPNGRIAFISERRGGYLRCGRACPNYTIYDMAADGSDIAMLSPHETNEWNPAVTNDGRIIYTRWDYVDRFGCTAHHPWITSLDGRDSRAVHGNFAPRNSRPDMELDTRPIPGSHKFISTAAPHHGQAFGSLVLIDPHVDDSEPMGPVKRVTPDVGFPESQGGGQVYGMPWALSTEYYIAAYDSKMQPGAGQQGGAYLPGNYGLYLVDAFGNKELLYRDPRIACMSPIPLKARPMPAAAPAQAGRSTLAPGTPTFNANPKYTDATGTVVVTNVYESLAPWPKDTKIKALRVFQVFPMPVPSGGGNLTPHETGHRIALAGDSVVPVRHVLGTVPVESDGSAHFTVPATRELFFQAIDDKGQAVQSMRSATYLHPGERLVCQGCHEPRHKAPNASEHTPLALAKPPVTPTPDVDGSRPFSYPRLVQPVLDKHCVSCHSPTANNPGKTLNLTREPITKKFYASYNALVPKYAFTSYGQNLVTVPGEFGAKAAKLTQILDKGHYDVKLSKEEMYRLTLWLDCSSMFYGVYEKDGGEAQLRGEIAKPTLE